MSTDRNAFAAGPSSQPARFGPGFSPSETLSSSEDSPSGGANGLRNRQDPLANRSIVGAFSPQLPGSPTGTFTSSDSQASLFRQNRVNTPPSSQRMIPRSKIVIKSDPMLLTSFDPADKELYDLWAPRAD